MKLLFVMDSLGTGGAERSNADFWYFLREKEVSFSIVILRKRREGIQQEILEANFPVYFLEEKSLWPRVKALRNIIQKEKPDLVHSVLFNSNLCTRLAKWRSGHNFVHMESLVNTTYDHSRLQDPAVSLLKLKAYQLLDAFTVFLFTDYFHAITETVAHHYQRKLGIPERKMRIIYRGRHPNPYLKDQKIKLKYRKEFGITASELTIISTGRQEYQKGHIYMIKALHFLESTYGFNDFKYIMLGREGQMSSKIEAAIQKWGLERKVLRLGHRYDVEQILAIGDIFAFPSLYEGLGVSLIEAQAAGLPIVSTDIPVFHEVLSPGKNAILVPPAQGEALAKALLELFKDPEKRKKFATESQQLFREKFQIGLIHQQMLDFFTEVSTSS